MRLGIGSFIYLLSPYNIVFGGLIDGNYKGI
jgi:hypothetical protein